jgi:recombination protein RecR
MMILSESLQKVIQEFKKMPGIGEKSATRLAFYLLRISSDEAAKLCRSVMNLKEKIRYCERCGNLTEHQLCKICTDPGRDQSLLCVVEEPNDLISIEKSGGFRGIYHVLMGAISPMEDIGPEELRIAELLKRVEGEGVREIVIATSSNLEGEATATYLAEHLKAREVKITRIARGIPMGGDLEYSDGMTICKALEGRMEI